MITKMCWVISHNLISNTLITMYIQLYILTSCIYKYQNCKLIVYVIKKVITHKPCRKMWLHLLLNFSVEKISNFRIIECIKRNWKMLYGTKTLCK